MALDTATKTRHRLKPGLRTPAEAGTPNKGNDHGPTSRSNAEGETRSNGQNGGAIQVTSV
jgi:hypothetical protein